MITQKPHFQGGGNPYVAPELEILTVEVEKGFAQTGGSENYSNPGMAGDDYDPFKDYKDYGDL